MRGKRMQGGEELNISTFVRSNAIWVKSQTDAPGYGLKGFQPANSANGLW